MGIVPCWLCCLGEIKLVEPFDTGFLQIKINWENVGNCDNEQAIFVKKWLKLKAKRQGERESKMLYVKFRRKHTSGGCLKQLRKIKTKH